MTTDEQLANLTRLVETVDAHVKAIGTIDTVNIQIQEGFRSLHQRLDYQGTRLEQHASQIAARNEWADSQDAWREQIDSSIDQHEQTLKDLQRRIEILESRKIQ